MAARYSRPALLARLLGNVTVQSVNLPLGKRREDHAHKIHRPLRAPRRALMRGKTSSAGTPFEESAES